MIFISYSSKDSETAGKLKKALEAKHYECFLGHDDIPAGGDWYEEIWQALRSSYAFIGLVTPDFNESAFCQQEVGAAFALDKPKLLLLDTAPVPSGFAARFQAVRRGRLLSTLDTSPLFRPLRVSAWTVAAREVGSFADANTLHDRFSHEWKTMTDDEKLRWLLAAASNNQVTSEGFRAGPFFAREREKLKPLMTTRWLFENDKESFLHDLKANTLYRKTSYRAKKHPPRAE